MVIINYYCFHLFDNHYSGGLIAELCQCHQEYIFSLNEYEIIKLNSMEMSHNFVRKSYY